MTIELPEKGFVFWTVGTGDSTSIVVTDEVVVQVDLHNLEKADDDDDPHVAIVDELVSVLPRKEDKPYLAVFVLTHPDLDHCKGFKELKSRVEIGELWFSPRIFAEYSGDLCDDAKAFKREAKRRVKKTIENNGDVESGDRVRVVGYDDLLSDEEYEDLPRSCLSVPGTSVTALDGNNLESDISVFIHAPFKDDMAGERNEQSIGIQVTLKSGDVLAKAILLGDHSYPTVKKVFEVSNEAGNQDKLEWNIFQAPHHCSKSVMYWKDEGDEEEKLKEDVLELINKASLSPGYIISSSEPIPTRDKKGANPPHAKAKRQYQTITPTDFICTQEHPNAEEAEPIIFEVTETGTQLVDTKGEKSKDERNISVIVSRERGGSGTPQETIEYG